MRIKEAFSEDEELEFSKKEQINNLPYVRWIFFLFIILYAFFGLTDLIYYPNNWQILFIIRFAIVIPLLLLVVLLSYKQSLSKFHQYYIAVSFFVGGAGIAYMLILYPENFVYYGGLFMIYFSGYLLIKLRFYYATISGLSIFLFHSIGHIIMHSDFSETVLFGFLFYIGANLIGMVGAYQFEVKNRKHFLHEKEIIRKNDELMRQYKEKDEQFIKLEQSIKENTELIAKNKELELLSKSLQESEEKYQTLHDTMNQGVVYQDAKGHIISCNPAAEKILGLSLSQMQGKTSMDPRWKMIDEKGNIIPGEKHPAMIALRTKEQVGPVVRGVYHPKKDMYVWLNIVAIPLFNKTEDKPYQVYATLEDVTDKKHAEEKLTFQHELMNYVIQYMKTGVAVHDKELNYLYVSDKYKSQYNVDEDIIGKHHYDVFPDLPEKWRKVHQRTLQGEVISADRDKFVHKDGHVDWTRWESRPWYEEDGNIGGIIIYTEVINTYIEKEEKLKQSEEQYRLLTTKMQLGLTLNEIICDDFGNPVDFRFISVNESWEKLMGIKKEEVLGKTVLEVFPNTEKSWIKVFGKVALTQETTKFENYASELGKYLSMSVYSPKKGQFATVVEDITEQRKQEELIDYSLKHDSLTDIPNRHYYNEKLREFDHEEYYPLAIIMMDINGLKLINDSFGQDAGNTVLKQLASMLFEEKQEDDFIARISGDEFVMLSPKTSTQRVIQFKQRLLDEISTQRINDMEYSIAVGYEIKEKENQEISEIVKEAENAMYKNKIVYGQGTRSDAIESVFSTLTNKYAYEKTHSKQVAKYSRLIGEQLHLREDELDELELAGRLHDIGKIAISDDILMKPGKLTEDEWKKIKDHTVNGYQILRAADKYSNLAEYAMSHHERMDGKGYPNGIPGKDIPLFARIICVADAYEAMTSNRTYRKAMKKEAAIKELKKHAGTQFDTKIVTLFIQDVLNEATT